jgi:Tfp pilus assembly pilus retraction ATPase PilT
MVPSETLLFLDEPLRDLDQMIDAARTKKATRLLILAGAPPVCRIGTQLSPPLIPQPLHFSQTHALATALLTPEQAVRLDQEGAVEFDYAVEGHSVRINVFFGDASHNFVVFL